MSAVPDQKFNEKLAAVFDAKWKSYGLVNHNDLRDRFVFHISQIYNGVGYLDEIMSDSEKLTTEEISDKLNIICMDTIPHLLAAGQIYDFVPDTFEEQKRVDRIEKEE